MLRQPQRRHNCQGNASDLNTRACRKVKKIKTQYHRSRLTIVANLLQRLSTGACVEMVGTLEQSPGKEQSKELQVKELKVLGGSDSVSFISRWGGQERDHIHWLVFYVDVSTAKETPLAWIFAKHQSFASKRKHRRRCAAGSARSCGRFAPVFLCKSHPPQFERSFDDDD